MFPARRADFSSLFMGSILCHLPIDLNGPCFLDPSRLKIHIVELVLGIVSGTIVLSTIIPKEKEFQYNLQDAAKRKQLLTALFDLFTMMRTHAQQFNLPEDSELLVKLFSPFPTVPTYVVKALPELLRAPTSKGDFPYYYCDALAELCNNSKLGNLPVPCGLSNRTAAISAMASRWIDDTLYHSVHAARVFALEHLLLSDELRLQYHNWFTEWSSKLRSLSAQLLSIPFPGVLNDLVLDYVYGNKNTSGPLVPRVLLQDENGQYPKYDVTRFMPIYITVNGASLSTTTTIKTGYEVKFDPTCGSPRVPITITSPSTPQPKTTDCQIVLPGDNSLVLNLRTFRFEFQEIPSKALQELEITGPVTSIVVFDFQKTVEFFKTHYKEEVAGSLLIISAWPIVNPSVCTAAGLLEFFKRYKLTNLYFLALEDGRVNLPGKEEWANKVNSAMQNGSLNLLEKRGVTQCVTTKTETSFEHGWWLHCYSIYLSTPTICPRKRKMNNNS